MECGSEFSSSTVILIEISINYSKMVKHCFAIFREEL